MPHDLNGNELKSGDVILIPCIVRKVSAGTAYCNLSCETLHPCFPSAAPSEVCLNTRQVTLCNPELLNLSLGPPKEG